MPTTNHPDRLDAALARPGRIDMKVEFKLANRDQIAGLFVRMFDSYPSDEASGKEERQELSARLRASAKEFAGKLPDEELSPAIIQGFLLRRMNQPEKALAEIGELLAEHDKSRKAKEEEEAEDSDESHTSDGEETELLKAVQNVHTGLTGVLDPARRANGLA